MRHLSGVPHSSAALIVAVRSASALRMPWRTQVANSRAFSPCGCTPASVPSAISAPEAMALESHLLRSPMEVGSRTEGRLAQVDHRGATLIRDRPLLVRTCSSRRAHSVVLAGPSQLDRASCTAHAASPSTSTGRPQAESQVTCRAHHSDCASGRGLPAGADAWNRPASCLNRGWPSAGTPPRGSRAPPVPPPSWLCCRACPPRRAWWSWR